MSRGYRVSYPAPDNAKLRHLEVEDERRIAEWIR